MNRLCYSALLCALLTSCDGTNNPFVDCDNLGTDEAALAASAVLDAIDDLAVEADMLAASLDSVCRDMARDLGVGVPPTGAGETAREAACSAVASAIRTTIDDAEATLTVNITPARCAFSVTGYAECVAECDVDVNADVDVMCTEGQLSGGCTGTCMGSCTLDGNVACEGTCRGSCTGTCSGVCNGRCDGMCTVVDADGNCVGTCDGTCSGSCSATCSGTCEGSCVADISGSCEGTCRGSCDVDFEAPRCDGRADVNASADCQAACDAQLQAEAVCTEPEVTIGLESTSTADVELLVSVLQRHYPRFQAVLLETEEAVAAGRRLVDAARELRDASFRTVVCFSLAVEEAAQALASIEVSLSITVEVSASVVVE